VRADHDIHLKLDAAKGCEVAEVQLPRPSAGFSGPPPAPGQIENSDLYHIKTAGLSSMILLTADS
jgi:hypothetical protein